MAKSYVASNLCYEVKYLACCRWNKTVHDALLEDTEAAPARLLEGWQEEAAPSDWPERLAEAVRESRAKYVLMMHWLEQQHGVER